MTKTIQCDCCGEKGLAMQIRNGMRNYLIHNFKNVAHTAVTVRESTIYFPDELAFHKAFAFVKDQNGSLRKFQLKAA